MLIFNISLTFIGRLFKTILPFIPFPPVTSVGLLLYKFLITVPFSSTLSIDISNSAPSRLRAIVSPLILLPSFTTCNDISPDF